MTAPPLPDLSTLSAAQKDALIVALYETLLSMEDAAIPAAAPRADAGADGRPSGDARELRERIARSAPSRRNQRSVPETASGFGRALGLLDSRPLQIVAVLIGIAFLADRGIGWYQQRALAAQEQAALELRNAAFGGLYVELTRVAYEADAASYRATMFMQNSDAARPLYVLLSPVQVFVQTGLTWREVPAAAPPGTSWGVLKLDAGMDYAVTFKADIADWAELMPGYMHVRVNSPMLISRSAEPKDDIVQRNNAFYLYLKPQGADDAAIKRKSNFPGVPPIFIPMPPH